MTLRGKHATPAQRHSPLGLRLLALALAAAPHSAAADGKIAFDIPAQGLSATLDQIARTAGVKLLYADESVRNWRADKLKGSYTVQEALNQALSKKGLRYEMASHGLIAVKAESSSTPATLGTVRVMDQAGDPSGSYKATQSSTATKTDTPLMQTPMSVKVVTQQVMQDQQVVTLDQALRNVSGVVSGAGGDRQFFIRGFELNNYYRDGYPFQNQWYHTEDLTDVERVEVLKGPGSILYGRAEPGGIINFVTKQPLDTPYYSLRQQLGSFDWYRTNVDTAGPLTQDKNLAYRFNLGYQSNNTFQEFGGEERLFVAPTVRWKISEATTSTLKLEYSDIKKTGEGNLPLMGHRPAKLPRSQNLGDPWNLQEDEYVMLSLNTEHAFNENWKLRHRFNFSNYEMTISGMNVNGNWDTVTPKGDIGRFFWAQNIDGNDYLHNFFNALELTGKFETGPLKHTLLVGGDYLRSDVRSTAAGFFIPNTTNIFHPKHLPGPPAIPDNQVGQNNWTLPWFGLYAQDQVELPYHIHALAGLRYDSAETFASSENLGVKTPTKYDLNDRVSPRGGLLWQPIPELSLYGSYTENFGASNTLNWGIPLPPQTAQQWEMGAKTELFDGRFTATFAYFDLTKQNLPMQVGPSTYKAVGEAESRGVELDMTGELLPGWKVIGAYAYTPFAKTLKDTPNSGTVGQRLHNAPKHSGSLWTTYEFLGGDLSGLKLGAGAQSVSQRQIGYGLIKQADDTKLLAQAPGYVTVGLMASQTWKVGKTNLTAQLNIDNLLDKTYIGHIYSYGPSHYGNPRTFMGSIRVEY